MKIDYKVEPVKLEFKIPARTSRGAYTHHEMYVITLCDNADERRGVGELAPLPDLSCDRSAYPDAETVSSMVHDALTYMTMHHGEWPSSMLHLPALRFAMEAAWADMNEDSSLYSTAFARGECGIPFNGLVWMADYDTMLRQMQEKIDAGFTCIKLKIGAIDWQRELDLVRTIREHYDRETIEIRVDANGGFALGEAMSRMEELAAYDIHSIEQPIQPVWRTPGKTFSDMADLCLSSPLPIALDEELIGVNTTKEKEMLLDAVKPHYIVLKPTLHGGISGVAEWIDLARQRGIGSWITSALESNVGLQSVALLAAREYGPHVVFPQGLGTGQLFVRNIDARELVGHGKVTLQKNRLFYES